MQAMQLHLQTNWSFEEAHAKARNKNKHMKCCILYLAPFWPSSFTIIIEHNHASHRYEYENGTKMENLYETEISNI